MTRASKFLLASTALAAVLLVRPADAAAQFGSPFTGSAVIVDSAGPAGPQLLEPERLTALVRHEYPTLLRDAGVTGEARVRVRVNEAGRVERVIPVADTHQLFADAARRIARKLRFRPVAEGGAAGDVILRITFDLER